MLITFFNFFPHNQYEEYLPVPAPPPPVPPLPPEEPPLPEEEEQLSTGDESEYESDNEEEKERYAFYSKLWALLKWWVYFSSF